MAYRICFRGVSSLFLNRIAASSPSCTFASARSALLTSRFPIAGPAAVVATLAPTQVVSPKASYTTRDPPVANPEELPRGYSLARDKKKATHEWNENLASRSEAIVKAERMPHKDIAELQRETASLRTEEEMRRSHRRSSRTTAHSAQQQELSERHQPRTKSKQEEVQRIEIKEKTSTSVVRRVSPEQSM